MTRREQPGNGARDAGDQRVRGAARQGDGEAVDVDDVDDGPAFAAACAPLIGALGSGFMSSSQAKAMSKELGMSGRQAYMLGRGGVLGDVDADVVTAAFGFWPADVIREIWESARAIADVRTARDAFMATCRAWGRVHYADLTGKQATRLAELLAWVVDGTDVAGLPLYAGWRAVALPVDDLEQVAQLLHVLREYRGGVHLMAVVGSGITPLQAVLAGPGGQAGAAVLGWEAPFEDIRDVAVARAQAEALTDSLVSVSFDALGHDERIELLALLGAASQAAFGPSAA